MPVYVKMCLLKKTEKDNYKRKEEWALRELKLVDAVSADSAELRLDLDQRYSWLAASTQATSVTTMACRLPRPDFDHLLL